MSFWTYINGTIIVSPLGRTQAEKRYILDTVLSHLPIVSGSERDMDVYVIQKNGHNCSSSCDEFGQVTNNLVDRYGRKSRKRGWMETQDEYILVVNATLRDREFEDTYKEFTKWLCRLAKRVMVHDILVSVKGYEKSTIIQDKEYGKFYYMFEDPTWITNGKSEPNWCEYLLWDRAKNYDYPMMLAYKYFDDGENDAEVQRRLNYMRGNEQ